MIVHRELLVRPPPVVLDHLPSAVIAGNAARSQALLLQRLQIEGRLEDAFWMAPFHVGQTDPGCRVLHFAHAHAQAAIAFMVLLLLRVERQAGDSNELFISSEDPINICRDVSEALTPSTFTAQRISGRMKVGPRLP